jgi:hypothetical protein
MPLVNRLLDAFFRTLDAVDVARERIDRALGRSPRPEPWATQWTPEAPGAADVGSWQAPAPKVEDWAAEARPKAARAAKPAAQRAGRPEPSAKPAPKKAAAKGSRAAPKKKPARAGERPEAAKPRAKKGGGTNRKGSVDRSGKDFDSPRAKAIVEKIKREGSGVVADEASFQGKRVLARVLWALYAADRAGSELGLTAADASALLHLAAGMEVFSTNVARTCRDETDLIAESVPDGRIKRYKLTEAGRAAAAALATRPA